MSPQSSSSEDEFYDSFPHAGSASGMSSTHRGSADMVPVAKGTAASCGNLRAVVERSAECHDKQIPASNADGSAQRLQSMSLNDTFHLPDNSESIETAATHDSIFDSAAASALNNVVSEEPALHGMNGEATKHIGPEMPCESIPINGGNLTAQPSQVPSVVGKSVETAHIPEMVPEGELGQFCTTSLSVDSIETPTSPLHLLLPISEEPHNTSTPSCNPHEEHNTLAQEKPRCASVPTRPRVATKLLARKAAVSPTNDSAASTSANEHASVHVESKFHNTPNINSPSSPRSQSPSEYGGAPWGGMFSALGTLRSGLYGLVDPDAASSSDSAVSPSQNPPIVALGEESAMQRLVADMAPQKETSLLDGIDRTVEYATGRLGRAIAGSFRSFGYTLEPVSTPPTSPPACPPSVSPGEAVPSLASNVVSAGMTTLGRIGRRTAGIVSSARDRLAQPAPSPYLQTGPVAAEDLKKQWSAHFEAFGGPVALEALQVRTSAAAVETKRLLRSLPAADAAAIQDRLRAEIPVLDAGLPAVGIQVPWQRLGLYPVPEAEHAALEPLLPTPDDAAAEAAELRSAVIDTPLPPDATSLLTFLARRRMAVVAAAYVRTLFSVAMGLEASASEGVAAAVLEAAGAALGGLCGAQQYAKATGMLGAARQEALLSALATDMGMASGVVKDATALLEPSVRLAVLRGITAAPAPGNIAAPL